MLEQLQRRADGVRPGDARRCRDAEDVQHELADGVRGEVAVVDELVERGVHGLTLVATVRVDQPHKRRARQRERADGRSEAAHERVLRLALEGAVELLLEPVELREPIALDVVAELVDEPCEAVDREQVAARLAPEHE